MRRCDAARPRAHGVWGVGCGHAYVARAAVGSGRRARRSASEVLADGGSTPGRGRFGPGRGGGGDVAAPCARGLGHGRGGACLRLMGLSWFGGGVCCWVLVVRRSDRGRLGAVNDGSALGGWRALCSMLYAPLAAHGALGCRRATREGRRGRREGPAADRGLEPRGRADAPMRCGAPTRARHWGVGCGHAYVARAAVASGRRAGRAVGGAVLADGGSTPGSGAVRAGAGRRR